QRVEVMPARDKLDGIGDDLPADQGGPHPVGAHRDPIGDGDRRELHRRAARLTDARLGRSCQVPVIEVAGHGGGPGVSDPHDGALKRLPRIPDAVEERTGARRPDRSPRTVSGWEGPAWSWPVHRASLASSAAMGRGVPPNSVDSQLPAVKAAWLPDATSGQPARGYLPRPAAAAYGR